MSAATASSVPPSSSHPTSHSNASSSHGPSCTLDHAHTNTSSSRVRKPFQPHVLFRWTKPGETVSVVGSWNGWGKPLALERTADAFCRGHLFSRMLALPPGRHQYKFIVDGAWQYDPQCAFEADDFGNINNVVEVQGGREGGIEEGLEGEEEPEGEEEVKEESLSDSSMEGEEEQGHSPPQQQQQQQQQQLLQRKSSRPMMVDPRHAAKPTLSWVTMSGEQARIKWLHASKAMERLNVTRSDSVEGVIAGLSVHERQQVNQNLKEYGLHTPSHSLDNSSNSSSSINGSSSGARIPKSASLTFLPSSSSSSSSSAAAAAATAAATTPMLEVVNILPPSLVADFVVVEAETNKKPFSSNSSNSSSSNSNGTTTTLIRPEEKEQLTPHQQQHASSSSSPSLPPSLPTRPSGDDDIHPPVSLQKGVSRRGSCLAASFLGNSSGVRMTRSRSLTDLETMGGEYSYRNNAASNSLFALQGGEGGGREGGRGTVRTLQKKQAACCAAVGSCQVKSSVRREGKMILAMVGLPGRGKTHIARAIRRHLEWMGMKVGYFNSSEYRRQSLAGKKITPDFFDPTDGEAWQCRKEIAASVLQDTLAALESSIDIAVLDAANCTRARRGWIQEQVRASGLYATVIFIESICTVPEIIATNVHQTILRSPEYSDLSEAEAMADFERKNQHYLSIYETLEEGEEVPFLKLVDAGQKIVSFRINGYVPGRLLLLLANIHTKPRPIWFSRHGESVFNSQGRIGGDSPLSARGMLYAQKLEEFVHSVYKPDDPSDRANPNLTVWTSTLVRTGMTVAGLDQSWEVIKWRCLDEIDAGMCDGLTYNEVAAQFPEEYRKRKEDKYNYRYPRGESYQDLFLRLEPLLFEMLRSTGPLLVVGHQAILRILYGYLTGKRPEECPDLPVPLHTVIQLTPQAYGCEEVWHTPMPGGEELVGSANGHN